MYQKQQLMKQKKILIFSALAIGITVLILTENNKKYAAGLMLLLICPLLFKKQLNLFDSSSADAKSTFLSKNSLPFERKISTNTLTSSEQEIGLHCTVIYDNKKGDCELKEGFGFSCLLTWQGRRILFDTGGDSEAFFSNIKKLDIDLTSITHFVFSHQHWDHTAGFAQVLRSAQPNKAKLYLPHHFNRKLLRLIPPWLPTIYTKHFSKIDENIYSLGCVVN